MDICSPLAATTPDNNSLGCFTSHSSCHQALETCLARQKDLWSIDIVIAVLTKKTRNSNYIVKWIQDARIFPGSPNILSFSHLEKNGHIETAFFF